MFDKVETSAVTEKLVRKWLPQDLYSIDRMESWLTDMAEEGLFLESIGLCFARFRRGTARNVRYRIDVLSRELTADELALYDSCGWHWVLTNEESRMFGGNIEFYIFQADEDATVPELHTDPQEQAESLRRLNRVSFSDTLWALVALLVFVGLCVYPMGNSRAMGAFLLYGEIDAGWVQIPLWIFWSVFYLSRLRSVRRLRKRLMQGEPLDHRASYRRRFRYGVLRMAVPMGLIALLFVPLICVQMADSTKDAQSLPMPEGAPDFPAVRLSELEGREDLALADGIFNRDRTVTGAVESRIYESAAVDIGLTSLETICYKMPFAWESSYVLDWYLERYEKAVRVETDLVDEVWSADEPGAGTRAYLFVRDGRYVLQMQYNGKQALTEVLPRLAARLDEAAD